MKQISRFWNIFPLYFSIMNDLSDISSQSISSHSTLSKELRSLTRYGGHGGRLEKNATSQWNFYCVKKKRKVDLSCDKDKDDNKDEAEDSENVEARPKAKEEQQEPEVILVDFESLKENAVHAFCCKGCVINKMNMQFNQFAQFMEANEQELQQKSKEIKFCGELQRLQWLEKKSSLCITSTHYVSWSYSK